MRSARVRVARCSVVIGATWLGLACGSRSAVDACATGICERVTSQGGSDAGGAAEAGAAGEVAAAGSAGVGGFAGSAAAGGAAGRASGGAGAGATNGGAGAGSGGISAGAGAGGVGATGGMGGGGAAGVAGVGGQPSVAPIVLLLVDASFSMFQSSVWTPTYEALMGADGPIERYQERIRFGFASYRGPGQRSEDDPACADISEVPLSLENASSIRATYGSLSTRRGYFETPTGHALARVTLALRAEPPEVPKYLLLFSDGAPDTCRTTKPQCGQDRAVFAVQEAFRAGIETHPIGIGFGTEYDCDPSESRCNKDHFQDLANAGSGLPVQLPPEAYVTLPCAAETGGTLLAEYAQQGGLAGFAWSGSAGEVRNAVEALLAKIAAR